MPCSHKTQAHNHTSTQDTLTQAHKGHRHHMHTHHSQAHMPMQQASRGSLYANGQQGSSCCIVERAPVAFLNTPNYIGGVHTAHQ